MAVWQRRALKFGAQYTMSCICTGTPKLAPAASPKQQNRKKKRCELRPTDTSLASLYAVLLSLYDIRANAFRALREKFCCIRKGPEKNKKWKTRKPELEENVHANGSSLVPEDTEQCNVRHDLWKLQRSLQPNTCFMPSSRTTIAQIKNQNESEPKSRIRLATAFEAVCKTLKWSSEATSTKTMRFLPVGRRLQIEQAVVTITKIRKEFRRLCKAARLSFKH